MRYIIIDYFVSIGLNGLQLIEAIVKNSKNSWNIIKSRAMIIGLRTIAIMMFCIMWITKERKAIVMIIRMITMMIIIMFMNIIIMINMVIIMGMTIVILIIKDYANE